ncbi:MAG TPA: precorrin-3B synthase [Pilimelia sp.]|nr:precorrin-3B synthase [Pilimelia sp.]
MRRVWSTPGRRTPDACPGALRVHQATDGGLVRVRVPGGRLPTDHLAALAAAAADLGDGALHITSRGNLQIRGIAAGAESGLAARLRVAGLLPSDTHERVRNIVASTLSGRDGAGMLDVRPLVTALDRGLCADPGLARLPGRFLFALDDGRGDVTGLGGDVGLLAVAAGRLALLLAGVDTCLRVGPDAAAATALAAARAFLAERAAQRSQAWRLAELANGAGRVAARLGGAPDALDLPGTPSRPPPVGLVPQVDGRMAVCVAVPLGRLTVPQASSLCAAARAGGETYVTPWRTAVVPDLVPGDAERWLAALGRDGLVVDADSPWLGVTACAGRPGCAKALADVRSDAAAGLADGANPAGLPVHWAGCERRCGRPVGRHIEVVATSSGYRVRDTEG